MDSYLADVSLSFIKVRSQLSHQSYDSRDWCLFIFYRLCMIIYIVDISRFSASKEACQMHKKVEFYASSYSR